MNIDSSKKELTIDFTLPMLNPDGSEQTALDLQRSIKRHDPDTVSVRGQPEPTFAVMLESLKASGVSVLSV